MIFPENVRAWLYRIVVAAVPLLVAFDVIDPEHAGDWLAVAAAVLSSGLAAVNTSTDA